MELATTISSKGEYELFMEAARSAYAILKSQPVGDVPSSQILHNSVITALGPIMPIKNERDEVVVKAGIGFAQTIHHHSPTSPMTPRQKWLRSFEDARSHYFTHIDLSRADAITKIRAAGFKDEDQFLHYRETGNLPYVSRTRPPTVRRSMPSTREASGEMFIAFLQSTRADAAARETARLHKNYPDAAWTPPDMAPPRVRVRATVLRSNDPKEVLKAKQAALQGIQEAQAAFTQATGIMPEKGNIQKMLEAGMPGGSDKRKGRAGRNPAG